jgi:hypothetical protein
MRPLDQGQGKNSPKEAKNIRKVAKAKCEMKVEARRKVGGGGEQTKQGRSRVSTTYRGYQLNHAIM